MSHSEPGRDDEPLDVLLIDASDLAMVRARVRMRSLVLGLTCDRAADLVLAVHEIAVAAFAADPRPTLLSVIAAPEGVCCEFRDPEPDGSPPRVPAPRLTDPAMTRGRGWRLAAALCDEVVRAVDGTTIRVTMRTFLTPSQSDAGSHRSQPGD
ncbi:ATP-binding protein [Streptacidiphilus cavernicola]|uniref:ATP-binding protein n=1 Tax=Streptacidiphilus cavernicola TaxID=3342716 RepID=A0ABV6VZ80_9ACTN